MILSKVKIEVKGPVGSGKTTILNIIKEALSSYDIQSRMMKPHSLYVEGLVAKIERPAFPKEKKNENDN